MTDSSKHVLDLMPDSDSSPLTHVDRCWIALWPKSRWLSIAFSLGGVTFEEIQSITLPVYFRWFYLCYVRKSNVRHFVIDYALNDIQMEGIPSRTCEITSLNDITEVRSIKCHLKSSKPRLERENVENLWVKLSQNRKILLEIYDATLKTGHFVSNWAYASFIFDILRARQS